jgi:hypothetical protein
VRQFSIASVAGNLAEQRLDRLVAERLPFQRLQHLGFAHWIVVMLNSA